MELFTGWKRQHGFNIVRMAAEHKQPLITASLVLYIAGYLLLGVGGLSFPTQPVGSYVQTTSNSVCPAGAMWIESNDLHWCDGTTEYNITDEAGDNITLVDGTSAGPSGAAWIEATKVSSTGIYDPDLVLSGKTEYYKDGNPPNQAWDDSPSSTGSTSPLPPYSGTWTFTDGSADNNNQHHFSANGDTTTWNTNEYLVVWVRPVVGKKADNFTIQIHTTADNWDNRIQWGGTSCKYGSDGSTCNIYSTNTPPAGEWSGLVVACDQTGSGSCGETVDGLAFTTGDGDFDTYWDSGIFSTEPSNNGSIHWIDTDDDEFSYVGRDTGNDPAAPAGAAWVESGWLHYIDVDGNERIADTTPP